MNEKIDIIAAGKFFVNAKETFAALQHHFEEFRRNVEKHAKNNPYFDWKVSDLTESKLSFEVEYLTLKVRVVFSIRPAFDQQGVITFYLLDEFESSARPIDSFDYDAEYGQTGVQDKSGSMMYIAHNSHHLMTQIFRQAYERSLIHNSGTSV